MTASQMLLQFEVFNELAFSIKFNILEAVERLVDLIREHGKWVEPEVKETVGA